MIEHDTVGLRGILEELPTEKLDQILDEELQKDKSDPAAVRLILTILEDRDASIPRTESSVSEEARQKYRDRMEELFPREPGISWTPLLRVASILLVVGLLFAVLPQKAEAETFWEMLQRWSGSVLEFLNPREDISTLDYRFETENPGLKQVYDAVVELGVTEPMVPMWLPDGYELKEYDTKKIPILDCVWSLFRYNDNELIYKINVYDGETAHQYYKDDTHYESYEKNGTFFNIARNIDHWVVVWTKDNIECTITVDCQEETLRRILKSIYVMEDD